MAVTTFGTKYLLLSNLHLSNLPAVAAGESWGHFRHDSGTTVAFIKANISTQRHISN